MGEQNVTGHTDEEQARAFMRALLDDVHALSQMIHAGMLESDVRRIGAELEMFLIDGGCQPAPVAVEVLEDLGDPAFTTELARFNLEANLPAYEFGGGCLREMHRDMDAMLVRARAAAAGHGADVLLTGILPTLQLSDLGMDNMTPMERYKALNHAVLKMRGGGGFQIKIKGTDELDVVHDNVMLESCNTSFQIHFQVGYEEFAKLYNLAQAVSAPVLAAAVNSPLLLEKRLWKETRVALFQHSVDDRSDHARARGSRPRVRFGEKWIEESALEIFRDDIARFRVLLATDTGERSLDVLERGEIPPLTALRLHNGTVYRWNRPCYGISNGKAHLRIENRVLPAGPSVIDQMANAALFFGLMAALSNGLEDITQVMAFDDAKANFIAAARLGLKAQFTWFGGQSTTAADLLLNELIPVARRGLEAHALDGSDIDEYLGVLEERVERRVTGAQWTLASLASMESATDVTPHSKLRSLTAAMHERQWTGRPVHEWALAGLREAEDWRYSYETVSQYMTRDLYTVRPDDLVDLAANLMDWEHIRHIPVEDREGHLVGMITHRTLLRVMAAGQSSEQTALAIRDLMTTDVLAVDPDTSTLQAIHLMRSEQVGCLPVVDRGKLVGIVTKRDLFDVAARLLEDSLREFRQT